MRKTKMRRKKFTGTLLFLLLTAALAMPSLADQNYSQQVFFDNSLSPGNYFYSDGEATVPFAGLLADGKQHTVGVSVFNANSFFLATANLLVFKDHGSKQLTGGILSNDLTAAPMPVVSEHIVTTANGSTGSITVDSSRSFIITGFVSSSV